MKPYNLALLLFRLFAIILGIYLIYSVTIYFMNPMQDLIPSGNDSTAYDALRQKVIIRTIILYGGGSVIMYFTAPLLALLATAGAKE